MVVCVGGGYITMINPIFDYLMGVARLIKTNTFSLINELLQSSRPIIKIASSEHYRKTNTPSCVAAPILSQLTYKFKTLTSAPLSHPAFCMHCPHRGGTSD